MKWKSLLLFYLINFSIYGHAQKLDYNKQANFLNANKVWAFPNRAGVDFNSGLGVGIETAMTTGGWTAYADQGAASVCDPVTGKLLFYSNGATCWNANHKIMPNGTNLITDTTFILGVQGVVIVPFVDEENKYYLFSRNYWDGLMFYSIVDMTLDNGNGDIMPNFKNIALNALDTARLSHAMVAVPGNNCDVWLIVHEAYRPIYRSYNISAAGLNPTPVISTTSGTIMPLYECYMPGSLAVSPNRELIAMATNGFSILPLGGVTLARFDANSGKVSDELQIGASSFTNGTSVAFSPDNSKLYLVENDNYYLSQYDISNFDTASINASKYIINPISELPYLRLYNDTIYCTLRYANHLNAINNPNGSGASCGFQLNAINLFPGTASTGTLPVETVYAFAPDTLSILALDTMICSDYGNGIQLRPTIINAAYDYKWNNADTDTLHDIFEEGTYWVIYGNGCHTFIDTFRFKGVGMQQPIITIDSMILRVHEKYHSYQWMLNSQLIQGATQEFYDVTENGSYRVIVTNKDGCIDTSDIYDVTNVSDIEHLHKWSSKIRIYPNPAQNFVFIDSDLNLNIAIHSIDGRNLINAKRTSKLDLTGLSEGIYLLYVYDNNGSLLKVEKVIRKN